MRKKRYLGDGVYIQWDYGRILLTTEDGGGRATNQVWLEDTTMNALIAYLRTVAADIRADRVAAEQEA